MSLTDIRKHSLLRSVHEKCLALLQQFWVVGGLPEAVATYAATRDFFEVARIQQGIVATYRDDFHKYSSGKQHELVRVVFDRLPTMVGNKFKYANISRDYRAADIESALQQLCLARVASKVHHTSANGIPLAAEASASYFKTIYLDIGLMCAALKLSVLDLAKADLSMTNSGALAEQFIGQQLLAADPTFQEPALFYWARESKSASAELDYLLTLGQQIIPVEIKAGKSGTLKSLHQFLKEKKRHNALRFNADVPSLLDDSKTLTDGSTVDYQLLSIPLYMVGQTHRLLRELMLL
jgi:predicted AAA+ superfamily ATPase